MAERPTSTTGSDMPVANNQNSLTAGPRGPVQMQDSHLLEKLAHRNRERIPERTVHADGRGAYDTLTVAHDITKYIRVKARGAAVGQRDRRGFARRFQTKEGNGEFGGNDSWKS